MKTTAGESVRRRVALERRARRELVGEGIANPSAEQIARRVAALELAARATEGSRPRRW